MLLKHLLKLLFLLPFLLLPLTACDLIPRVTVNGTPVSVAGDNTPSSSGPLPLNVWTSIAPGVQLRTEDWKSPANNEDIVTILRLDPHRISLSVAYRPTHPLSMSQWMQEEHALAIINGGYFDQQDQTTALVISNGQQFGTSYNGFGGMLSVDSHGHIQLRSLEQHPYDPSENIQQATQSSPMLILPGGKRAHFEADASSSRRSVVAMDKQGHLLFIVSPTMAFSLDELADLLLKSDLDTNVALNLDGGASTGLYVNTPSQRVAIDSLTPLPIVVVIKGL